MDIAWVRQRINDPALAARLARAAEVLGATVEAKRRIIHDLRPTALDNLGLSAAIEFQVPRIFHSAWVLPIETDAARNYRN